MKEINRRMATGAAWMSSLRLLVRGLGVVSTIILARLLVPADFGLVAMATSVVAFLELATAFSFDVPLIQKQSTSRQHFDTAWTLNIAFYISITILLLLLAKPAAAFYQDQRLSPLLYFLAVGFLVRAFANIGVVEFRKKLEFRKEFVLLISQKTVSLLVTIPLAYYLRSYWALVIGIVTGNILGVLLTYVLHPFRPRLSLSEAREMMGFSRWLIINNGFEFLRVRLADFIIGRLSGPAALGLFSISYEISTLATTEVVAPINRAVFPGYAIMAGDVAVLRQSYLNVLAIVAILALPASFGISAIASPLVLVFFGAAWAGAGPIVALLAIFGGLSSLQTNISYIFNARGKPQLNTLLGFINVSVLLSICIPLALRYGPVGVATGYVVAYALLAPLNFGFVCKEISARWTSVVAVLWRPALASLIMFIALRYIDDRLLAGRDADAFTALLVLIPSGVAIYAIAMTLLWVCVGMPVGMERYLAMAAVRRLRAFRVAPR